VHGWADLKGFDYRFMGDSFFDLVPTWYKERVKGNPLLLSDLARLVLVRQLLQEGYDRAIWVDADVVVFDPESLEVRIDREYAFAREVWVRRIPLLGFAITRYGVKVHNAFAVFVRGNSILDFLIHSCETVVATKTEPLLGGDAGVFLLSKLYAIAKYPLILDVGMLSPALSHDILKGGGAVTRGFMERNGSPIHAANLCNSYDGISAMGVRMDDARFNTLIDLLLETKGRVVNRFHRSAR